MHPILPAQLPAIDKPQINLIDQSSSLQEVTSTFSGHVGVRHTA
jgi:hypothetical protein